MRYLVPTFLGLQLAAIQILTRQASGAWRPARHAAIVGVVLLGALSSTVALGLPGTGKALGGSGGDVACDIARLVNESERPLVIVGPIKDRDNLGETIAMGYLLEPHARLRLVADPTAPLDLARYTDVFVYRLSTAGRLHGALFRVTTR